MEKSPQEFDRLLTEVLSEVGAFQVVVPNRKDATHDFRVVKPDSSEFQIDVKEFKRITPAIAESACLTLKQRSESTGAQPIIYAAIVSDRTSEIAARHGVSWMDYAGNCRLVFPKYGIYVRRSGTENPFGKQLPKVINVFSPKSSRVVRATLQEPMRGWQLNELAGHRDVRVSPGLMSRIKQSLVEGGYALMRDGKLRLKRPDDLLEDWVEHYRTHKPKEWGFYMRGEPEQVEQQIAKWCSESGSEHALSRFSAAWRLAPEVRYNVVSLLVTKRATLAEPMLKLVNQYGARKVESGANLILQITDDESYLSNRVGDALKTTSTLQTYLDLMAMDGRGEDAAVAIFEKYFKLKFAEASELAMENYEGN